MLSSHESKSGYTTGLCRDAEENPWAFFGLLPGVGNGAFAYYRIGKVGLDLSSQKVIELFAQAKMTISEQDKTKKTLYLKQGILANAAKNNEYANAVAKLMRVAGIEPPSAIEDSIGLARKLKVSSNIKLAL